MFVSVNITVVYFDNFFEKEKNLLINVRVHDVYVYALLLFLFPTLKCFVFINILFLYHIYILYVTPKIRKLYFHAGIGIFERFVTICMCIHIFSLGLNKFAS